MSNILVLDCTLRDGGYVNSWNFGKDNIETIAHKLADSGIEIIECGFLSQTKKTDENKSIFSDFESAEKFIPTKSNSDFAVMINYGEYNINDIPNYKGGIIDTVRVAFHKDKWKEAVDYCAALIKKGYKVFVQPMVTVNYLESEFLELIKCTNNICPKAFYIVDSFGTINKTELLKMYNVIESNLNKNIAIGFHSHNNMQLSFSNAQELMDIDSSHDIIIDSSVYGMGRGAGNLCSELLTKYINDNYNGNYDLIPILEIIDEQLMPIFLKSPWGYSVPFYVASINNCHPNYASFLLERQTLSVKDIHKILSEISDEKKVDFDKEYIRNLYENYQSNHIDDFNVIEKLRAIFCDKAVLVIAPGSSIEKQKKKVLDFCTYNNPIVITVNFLDDDIESDFVFVGNQKRYRKISNKEKQIIVTSNISVNDTRNVMVVDYNELLNENEYITDNSGMMILNLLRKAGAKDVYLAGYDGFSENIMDNYYRDKLISGSTKNDLINISDAIREKINLMRSYINIEFVTDSMYDK